MTATYPDSHGVIWDTPSADSSGSMPLGNGEVGLNAWVDPAGTLWFYLARTDAWSEGQRLLKLGLVSVALTPAPLTAGADFRQSLALRRGAVEVQLGGARLRLWVDAHRPVVHVDVDDDTPRHVEARLHVWRTQTRTPADDEGHTRLAPQPQSADHVLADDAEQVVWYHRNETSAWAPSLRLQSLDPAAPGLRDPLLGRTFGGALFGDGCRRDGELALRSTRPAAQHRLVVVLHTAQTDGAAAWRAQLAAQVEAVRALAADATRAAHEAWWAAFWDRSQVEVTRAPVAGGDDLAAEITRAWVLQRWIHACAGRGAYPIKFNGSLFTVDAEDRGTRYDGDYRRWGGCYWFQNTRLPYWSMLASGDFDLMRPLFRLYRDCLPLARQRNRVWFGTEGAFFPETMTLWGLFADIDYGQEREGRAPGQVRNAYVRHIWSVGLELLQMWLDLRDHGGASATDADLGDAALLEMADAVLAFFDGRFARDGAGKLIVDPAQACETWQEAINPMPEVAGLHAVLPRLLALGDAVPADRRSAWTRLQGELPDLPVAADGAHLLPAAAWVPARRNVENPELYAVFPFRLFGVGQAGDLEVARRTFARRLARDGFGWQQDGVQAARLGLADEAAAILAANVRRRHEGSRFPAFWGPNYDWVPDQDHGGNLVNTVQTMLLQAAGDAIHLLPAWPAGWAARFRLHAPGGTVVDGEARDGRVHGLRVSPAARAADVAAPG